MNIAILAWGSLIWEQRSLALATGWNLCGPKLPVEFSRISISRSGALTLVIDAVNGTIIPTFVALSSCQSLIDAMDNLGEREGGDRNCVGYVNCKSGESYSKAHPPIANIICDWARNNAIDAVIWTDLLSNFETIDKARFSDIDEPNMIFSIENAQRYLHGLRAPGDEQARTYIKNAPPHVETRLRRRLAHDPWLFEPASSSSLLLMHGSGTFKYIKGNSDI